MVGGEKLLPLCHDKQRPVKTRWPNGAEPMEIPRKFTLGELLVVITVIGIVAEFLATLQEMGYIGPVTIKPSRSRAAAQPELAATAD